jgi:squalene-hopene/tetraprenyl-beta-curcumene cyclase
MIHGTSRPKVDRRPAPSSPAAARAPWLADLQARDGHWCAELTADTTLESDYILFQLWLYPPRKGRWDPPTRPLIDKAVRSILDRQLPDGGFNIYAEGPSEVSASVKAYFALKLAGVPSTTAHGAPARAHPGPGRHSGGQQLRQDQPQPLRSLSAAVLPQHSSRVVLLPFDLLYQMSAWTRAIVVSLSIVHAANPRRPVPAGFQLDELWLPGASPALHRDPIAGSPGTTFSEWPTVS